jgi:hypothetical protein
LIPKVEAEGAPVGEAQDDPNDNPRLEKPTEGRGFKDKLAATVFDIGKISVPKFNMFRNMMIVGVVAVVIIIILIVIMFLKK